MPLGRQQSPHQQRGKPQKLWPKIESLPDDVADKISRLAHKTVQQECIKVLQSALRCRAARLYKQKRDALMKMDDNHPQITTLREEVLCYHWQSAGLDTSSCWEMAHIWPDELEILHCMPDLV